MSTIDVFKMDDYKPSKQHTSLSPHLSVQKLIRVYLRKYRNTTFSSLSIIFRAYFTLISFSQSNLLVFRQM